ncbi:hypothetical protein [Streptococcus sanguinis]|uniref:hypothetical protein n=1 Tax=Streptococcus sanguinis TaxID=1305 RepID=UPI0039C02886
MDNKDIKQILDEHGIDNSENLSKALAQVLEEFSNSNRISESSSSPLIDPDVMRKRMSGIVD